MNRTSLLALLLVLLSGVLLVQNIGVQPDSQQAQDARSRAETVYERSDPIGREPDFIFHGRTVRWTELAPRLAEVYGDKVRKTVLGTFPVAGQVSGSDVSGLDWDNDAIHFPAYGSYYLHTSVGFFKILLLDPDADELTKVLDIAAFISGNIVHSLANFRELRPMHGQGVYTPERLLPVLFASDQPVKLHCGGASEFAAYVFRRQGYRTQLVQLADARGRGVHVVMQLYLPSLDKYVMVDPDFGAMVQDKAGRLLSVPELASALRGQPQGLRILDVGNSKRMLQKKFNQPQPMPDFAWTPDKSTEASILDPLEYLQDMKGYTSEYWLLDWADCDWGAPRMFRWDGSPIDDE